MDGRKNKFRVFCLAVVLFTAACTHNQPARFHTPFLPPAAKTPAAVALEEPPELTPNPFVSQMPPLLLTRLQLQDANSRVNDLVQRANLRYQRGKGYYQANNIAEARREFDAAIDMMLEASAQDPADRTEFEKKLDEMVDAIHRYDLAGMGASAAVEEGRFDKAPLEDILQMTFPVDPRLKDKVREQVAATVSQLPLTVNDAVLGYINFFMNRGHRTVVNAIERSGRYRPMIQRILDDEGLPQELIHLAQAESGFFPRAMSRKAAGGMWQFVRFRGNEYGLLQSPYTDDRMDPEKATRAAAHHLHDLYSEFGDWYLAIAAYNCGPVVVEKAVERTGYADFWELRSRGVLPAETTNYVPIILALTIMEKNAAEYGLDGIQMDPPLEYDTVDITARTSMALVSDITETPLPELATLNPAVLKGSIPSSFPLHVPKGTGNQLVSALDSIPPQHRDAWRMHRVGTGETLAAIGKRYGVALSSLVAVNNLQAPEAAEGDRLIIPAVLRVESPAKKPVVRAGTRRVAASASSSKGKTARSKSKPAHKPAAKGPVIIARTKVQ
ncbi:MAG TPA: transglycosylase SLT domain-containing protein [Bryobacteraceae bacterium]|nr:transglycosylase SLT domain-containing protein [Bryobacteraceae bacterium]